MKLTMICVIACINVLSYVAKDIDGYFDLLRVKYII